MTLAARDVSWSAGGRRILNGVSVTAPAGGVLGLVGPNGSGKSSLLRLLGGLRRPDAGDVLLDGRPVSRVRRAELARRLAFVEQHSATEMQLRVRDVVSLGRTPHRGAWGGWTPADEAAVAAALETTGMTGRAGQSWSTLSGGERQRVQVARALAQEPREILLDEPTNHLDIRHQLELLDLLRSLRTTCVIALHDLDHAAAFCDCIAVLDRGRLVTQGLPAGTLTPGLIRDVFAVEATQRYDRHGTLRIDFTVAPPPARHRSLQAHCRSKPEDDRRSGSDSRQETYGHLS
ncbi:ABC transporter ATP-binding protein [Roseivivax sediminis]|uniref:Iron complex transport system ATP-binding protein n=1 Tax=Roseivivax sediminis TaxID=936889 RepID=A0A1I1WAD5_9RHOB|nr:ABC transporter ATP-binding protein [Roseivivax sediminis]SFD92165.1 iron complex transport system ATP-binding protein [Roseivivax sediminis]